MRDKFVLPTTSETSFNCPHCGALAKQFWHATYTDRMSKDAFPQIWTENTETPDFDDVKDDKRRAQLKKYIEKLKAGRPFLESTSDRYPDDHVPNLFISKCYNCDDIAIWIHDRLVWPNLGEAPKPNNDLPEDILRDYEEAGTILDLSPRGAAALLRLCIQKLCKHLGESGDNINGDIAALVEKGLDTRVQQSLDIVRVVGNEAVHPGQLDLRDDRATAEKLFGLINLIANIMISQPKDVQEMYGDLPEDKRKAIEKRDKARK